MPPCSTNEFALREHFAPNKFYSSPFPPIPAGGSICKLYSKEKIMVGICLKLRGTRQDATNWTHILTICLRLANGAKLYRSKLYYQKASYYLPFYLKWQHSSDEWRADVCREMHAGMTETDPGRTSRPEIAARSWYPGGCLETRIYCSGRTLSTFSETYRKNNRTSS